MRKAFISLLLLQRVCFCLFEPCKQSTDYFKIIDKWWTGGLNVSYYYTSCVCYNMLSADLKIEWYHHAIDAVIIKESNISTVPNNTYWERFPEQMRGMQLSNNFIEAIEVNAFAKCTELREINLQGNNITSLPDGLFAKNSKLQIIDLSHNEISSVGKTTFSPQSIKYINLRHNQLQKLDFELSESLINLEFSYNVLSLIARDAFSRIAELTSLKLNNNALREIPIGLFKSNSNLNELDLSNNSIPVFEQSCFFLHKLKILNLSHIRLRVLNLMFPLSLESLDLSFNNLASINNDSFLAMRHLEILKLNDNSLKTLTTGAFEPLENLKKADLQRNKLTSLPRDLFARNKILVDVNLSENNISSVAKTALQSNSVQTLNLKSNKIADLNFTLPKNLKILNLFSNSLIGANKSCFYETIDLTMLNLNNNRLTSLPSSFFQTVTSAREIHLDRNQLTEIHEGVFHSRYTNLSLHFSYNNILFIGEEALPWKGVTSLYLRNNKLRNLKFQFPLTLIILDLSYNSISVVERGAFDGLKDLKYLQLNNNLLHTLQYGCFLALKNLRTLQLANNTIEMVEGLFNGLNSLQVLNLSNNSITELPIMAILSDLHSLLDLDISNNYLTELQTAYIAWDLKHLNSLYLQNNRFQCHHLLDTVVQLITTNIVIKDGDKSFESQIGGIHCIPDTCKNPTQQPNTNQFVPLLQKTIDLISNLSKEQHQINNIQTSYFELFKNISSTTLQALNSSLTIGNVSGRSVFEEIERGLIFKQTSSRKLKDSLRLALGKISSNQAVQLEILTELLEEIKNNSTEGDSYIVATSETIEGFFKNISDVLSADRDVEGTCENYAYQIIVLLSLFLIVCLLFYGQYKEIKKKNTKYVAGSTEMNGLILEH